MDKIAQKKNEKYQNLISAAFELFEHDGVSGVSIDDIVKKAGVAKGTFYLYFKDKFDLISKLILKKATDFLHLDAENMQIQNDADFDHCVARFVDILMTFLEKNKTLTLLIDKNVDVCVSAMIENREGPLKALYDNILAFFESRGFSAEEVRIKIYIYIDMIVSSCCNAILRGKPYSLQEIKPHLYEIVAVSIYGAEQYKINCGVLPPQ
ncbi:MAG: TetR/AcrR family transcriptional regulator [Ruminococcus sp.]|nr:TetR/AcrR family transcriptional regulator [Ruminococcus sp.]